MRANTVHFLVVAVLLAACAPQQTPTPPSTSAPASPEPSVVPSPVATEEIASTSIPTMASIQTPYVPFFVNTIVENAVLRANPGALFTAKTTLAQNTRLLVLGIAPGREWVFVQTPLDSTGWVFAQLLEVSPNLAAAPLMQPADIQLVRGRLLGTDGLPLSGIQYALIEGVGSTGSPPRTDAMTDANGFFYAFLPLTASGTWTVSFTAIACTSRLMGPTCECVIAGCGKSDPEITTVTLPTDQLLEFTWR